jgi:branched-chain amino acid transport system permease protein
MTDYRRLLTPAIGVGSVAVALSVPMWLTVFEVALVTSVIALAIFGVAFNIAFGFAHLPAFGHAAFYGLGAYGVAVGLKYTPETLAIPILLGVVSAFLYGVFVGTVSVRGRGIYFAVLTFTFGQLLYELFFRLDVTGGSNGLPLRIPDGALAFLGDRILLYYVALGVLFAILLFGHRLLNSPFGKAMRAVADNEERAKSIGYPVTRIKIIVFTLTATLTSFAGVIHGLNNRFVSVDILFYSNSIEAIIVATIGGTGSLVGPVVGSLFYVGLTELFAGFADIGTVIIGVVFVVVVFYFPSGLMGIFDRL